MQTSSSTERAFVVSLHDVSPHTFEVSRKICEELVGAGIRSISLLVIPDHHRRGHFLDYPEFLDWLRSMAAAGHEAVIHGYFHRREPAQSEDLRTRVITRFYTAGEGEFHDISTDAATCLLTQAKAEFQQAGLAPTGFIAPAWLLGEEARAVLPQLGFQYTTLLREVVDFQTGKSTVSQSLVYSTRAAWRRVCSLGWNRFLFSKLRHLPLVRLGIHPPEFGYPAIWGQIRELVDLALRDRTPLSYQDWVSAQH